MRIESKELNISDALKQKEVISGISSTYADFRFIDFYTMPDYFRSLPDIDKDFFVFRDGVACKEAVYRDNENYSWQTIKNLFQAEKCTLYIRNLEKYDDRVAKILNEIKDVSGRTSFVNLFVTPGLSVGLPVHLDLTDFFVVQLYGRKRWKIWEAPPRNDITRDRRLNAKLSRKISLKSPPKFDFELVEGNSLYVPFGTIHEPISEEEGSIHLTIGVFEDDYQSNQI